MKIEPSIADLRRKVGYLMSKMNSSASPFKQVTVDFFVDSFDRADADTLGLYWLGNNTAFALRKQNVFTATSTADYPTPIGHERANASLRATTGHRGLRIRTSAPLDFLYDYAMESIAKIRTLTLSKVPRAYHVGLASKPDYTIKLTFGVSQETPDVRKYEGEVNSSTPPPSPAVSTETRDGELPEWAYGSHWLLFGGNALTYTSSISSILRFRTLHITTGNVPAWSLPGGAATDVDTLVSLTDKEVASNLLHSNTPGFTTVMEYPRQNIHLALPGWTSATITTNPKDLDKTKKYVEPGLTDGTVVLPAGFTFFDASTGSGTPIYDPNKHYLMSPSGIQLPDKIYDGDERKPLWGCWGMVGPEVPGEWSGWNWTAPKFAAEAIANVSVAGRSGAAAGFINMGIFDGGRPLFETAIPPLYEDHQGASVVMSWTGEKNVWRRCVNGVANKVGFADSYGWPSGGETPTDMRWGCEPNQCTAVATATITQTSDYDQIGLASSTRLLAVNELYVTLKDGRYTATLNKAVIADVVDPVYMQDRGTVGLMAPASMYNIFGRAGIDLATCGLQGIKMWVAGMPEPPDETGFGTFFHSRVNEAGDTVPDDWLEYNDMYHASIHDAANLTTRDYNYDPTKKHA